MGRPTNATGWLIAITLLLAYEGYEVLSGTPRDILSECIWAYGAPFAAGVLVGHFFWQRKPKYDGLRVIQRIKGGDSVVFSGSERHPRVDAAMVRRRG